MCCITLSTTGVNAHKHTLIDHMIKKETGGEIGFTPLSSGLLLLA
jgi:hypothetical protein